jgi:excisionase family DNA binding protein
MPHARIAEVPLSDRAAFSLGELSGLTGLSISGLYLLINRGELRSIRIGGRRLVTRAALDEFLGLSVQTPPLRRSAP